MNECDEIFPFNSEWECTCKCCCGSGTQRRNDGIKIICPCCNGTGKRKSYIKPKPYKPCPNPWDRDWKPPIPFKPFGDLPYVPFPKLPCRKKKKWYINRDDMKFYTRGDLK
jgi:hypothetical protein